MNEKRAPTPSSDEPIFSKWVAPFPAPRFHAATVEMRKFLWSVYAEFVGRYRDAAEKLRAAIATPSARRPAWLSTGGPSPGSDEPERSTGETSEENQAFDAA